MFVHEWKDSFSFYDRYNASQGSTRTSIAAIRKRSKLSFEKIELPLTHDPITKTRFSFSSSSVQHFSSDSLRKNKHWLCILQRADCPRRRRRRRLAIIKWSLGENITISKTWLNVYCANVSRVRRREKTNRAASEASFFHRWCPESHLDRFILGRGLHIGCDEP